MRRVTKIETNDRVLHPSEVAARRYVESHYANEMSRVCNSLAGLRYEEVVAAIEELLPNFESIIALKKELDAGVLPEDDDDEDF